MYCACELLSYDRSFNSTQVSCVDVSHDKYKRRSSGQCHPGYEGKRCQTRSNFYFIVFTYFLFAFFLPFFPFLAPWTRQLKIGFYDDNFYMPHQNFIKRQNSRKGNFTDGKFLKYLKVYSKTIKNGTKYARPLWFSPPKICHIRAILFFLA